MLKEIQRIYGILIKSQPVRIAAVYVAFGVCWILFSDLALGFLARNEQVYQQIQMFKGWFYVLLTGSLLFIFLKFEFRRVEELIKELTRKDEELKDKLVLAETYSAELTRRNRFIDQIYNGINCVILVWDLKGQIIESNTYFNKLLGYEDSEIVGQVWEDLFIAPEHKGLMDSVMNSIRRKGYQENNESIIVAKNGERHLMLWNDRLLEQVSELGPLIISFGVDISKEQEKDAEINKLLFYDKVTEVGNQIKLEIDLKDHVKLGNPFTLVMVDINQLGRINNQFGFETGDLVIKHIAAVLKHTFPEDSIYKWHASSFVVLLNYSIRGAADIEETLVQLFSGFSEKIQFKNIEIMVPMNAGIVNFPEHSLLSEELMSFADLALKKAKRKGSQTFAHYTERLKEVMLHEMDIELFLDEAVATDELEIYLQPIYDVFTNRTSSYEVLLRSFSERLYFESIADLIKVAERTGQIIKLDKWVINKAFRLVSEQPEHFQEMDLSINLSVQSVGSIGLIHYLREKVFEYKIDTSRITFELTEHALISDFNSSKTVMTELKKMGFRLALDDFGTEYSSLNYLAKLPFDCLKIDKSFVDEITSSVTEMEIVRALVKLCDKIGLRVVAEGVESIDQYECLQVLNCRYIQGYYISKPFSVESLMECLNSEKDSLE